MLHYVLTFFFHLKFHNDLRHTCISDYIHVKYAVDAYHRYANITKYVSALELPVWLSRCHDQKYIAIYILLPSLSSTHESNRMPPHPSGN